MRKKFEVTTFIDIDYDKKIIKTNLSKTGLLYSSLKDIWISDGDSVKFPFPCNYTYLSERDMVYLFDSDGWEIKSSTGYNVNEV